MNARLSPFSQLSQPPSIPGTMPNSPAVNPANGNLFYTMPVVSAGPYDAPSVFTCNAAASCQTIDYGAGVAGIYNRILIVASNLTQIIDPAGNTTTYSYDTSNRVTSITSPLNEIITYNYVELHTVGRHRSSSAKRPPTPTTRSIASTATNKACSPPIVTTPSVSGPKRSLPSPPAEPPLRSPIPTTAPAD